MTEYIEREAFLDAIERGKKYQQDADDIVEMLQNIPAADVRPVVRGKWEPSMCGTKNGPIQDKDEWYGPLFLWDEWYGPLFLCSECGADMIGASNFCPNCGADMREGN